MNPLVKQLIGIWLIHPPAQQSNFVIQPLWLLTEIRSVAWSTCYVERYVLFFHQQWHSQTLKLALNWPCVFAEKKIVALMML